MNCRELEIASESLLEGETHPDVDAHVASCARCRVLVEDLKAITGAARELSAFEIEPSPALWGRIRAAAREEQVWVQPMRWRWLGLGEVLIPARAAFAGALALMVVAAVGLVIYPTLQLPVAQAGPPDPFGVAQGELINAAGYANRYYTHLENVEEEVRAEETPVTTELLVLVERPMGDVNRAIEQTQLQLETFPEDTLARQELRRLYQQKAVVLQAMADASWYEDTR
jgi:hypothetical protein